MTTETTVSNTLSVEESITPSTGLLKTGLWTIALLFLPQIILSFAFGIFYGVQQGDNFTPESFEAWFATIPVLLTLSLISPLITLPLLMKATDAKDWSARFNFWSIKAVNRQKSIKWLVVGLVFWGLSSLIGEFLNIPVEQFMLDVKSANNSFTLLALILTAVCFVIPVMEELVFRGWMFSKISLTKLGNLGALIITSVIFTLVHSQYENGITLAMIFALGMLLGFVRFKSNNVSYSVLIHMLFNSLAMAALFLL